VHTLDAENEDLQAQLFALRRQQQDRFQRPVRGFQGEVVLCAATSCCRCTSTRPAGCQSSQAACVVELGVLRFNEWELTVAHAVQMATGNACSRRLWTIAAMTHGGG